MAAFFPCLRIKSPHKIHNAGKTQVTPVGASVSAPLYLNGGIPQGTKWGSVLFAIMVNDLVQSWGAHIKLIFFTTTVAFRAHSRLVGPILNRSLHLSS